MFSFAAFFCEQKLPSLRRDGMYRNRTATAGHCRGRRLFPRCGRVRGRHPSSCSLPKNGSFQCGVYSVAAAASLRPRSVSDADISYTFCVVFVLLVCLFVLETVPEQHHRRVVEGTTIPPGRATHFSPRWCCSKGSYASLTCEMLVKFSIMRWPMQKTS